MPKVAANGIDLYYESKGSGPTLLLIAGFACDLSIWSKLVSALAGQWRVIAFDNRGVGRSSAPDSPYTIRQMADDTAALLDALAVPQAHVAGHSMGGQIAQELAIHFPDKVRSLQLLATCAKPDERNRAIIESWGEMPGKVDAALAARLSLPWVYTERLYARPNAIQQVIDILATSPPPAPHGIYHQSRAVMAFDASRRLTAIRCPTLVLAGAEDVLLPVRFSEELHRGIHGSEFVVLPQTGHGLTIESADAVAAAMQTFLAKHVDLGALHQPYRGGRRRRVLPEHGLLPFGDLEFGRRPWHDRPPVGEHGGPG